MNGRMSLFVMSCCAAISLSGGCATRSGGPRPEAGKGDVFEAIPTYAAVPVRLTESAIIDLALSRSPEIEAARIAADLAAANRRSMLLPGDPEIRTAAGWRGDLRPYETRDDRQYAYALRIAPRHPGITRHTRRRLLAEFNAAQADLGDIRESVASRTRLLLFEIAATEARLELQQKRLEIARRRRGLLRERTEYRGATVHEVLDADAGWNRACDGYDALYASLRHLYRRLVRETGCPEIMAKRSAWGADAGSDTAATGSPRPETLISGRTPGPHEAAALYKRAGSFDPMRHPRAIKLAARAAAARADSDATRARRIPWLSHVQGEFGHDNRTDRGDAWSLQAAVEIPVFSGSRAAIDAAEKNALLAAVNLRAEIARVQAGVDEAAARLMDNLVLYQRKEDRYRPMLRDLRELLNGGQAPAAPADPLTLLEQERTLLNAEATLLDARLELERSYLLLEIAMAENGRQAVPVP